MSSTRESYSDSAASVCRLLDRAEACVAKRQFCLARNLFLQALRLDDDGRARNAYGCFLWRRARYAEAAEQFRQLLTRSDALSRPASTALAASNLAAVYREWGQPEAAAHFQQLAVRLELAAQPESPAAGLSGGTVGNLAADAILAGDYWRAEQLLWRSCLQEMAAGSLEGQAADWGNLGLLAALQGDFAQGVEFLWRALRLHRKLRDGRGIGCDLLHLGQFLGKLGHWRPAIRVLARAEQQFLEEELFDLLPKARAAKAEAQRSLRLAEFDPQVN